MSRQFQRTTAHDVGIFWDLRSIGDCVKYPHGEFTFSPKLGHDLMEMAWSLGKSSVSTNTTISSTVFCDTVESLSPDDCTVLRDLGFETVVSTSREKGIYPDIGGHVLLWLWDRAVLDSTSSSPTIIFVSSDKKYLRLLETIKSRGIFVVYLSDLSNTELRSECIRVSNMMLDIHQQDISSPQDLSMQNIIDSDSFRVGGGGGGGGTIESEISTTDTSASLYDPTDNINWLNSTSTLKEPFSLSLSGVEGTTTKSSPSNDMDKEFHLSDQEQYTAGQRDEGDLFETEDNRSSAIVPPVRSASQNSHSHSLLQAAIGSSSTTTGVGGIVSGVTSMSLKRDSLQDEFAFRNDRLMGLHDGTDDIYGNYDGLDSDMMGGHHLDDMNYDMNFDSNDVLYLQKITFEDLSYEQRIMQEQLATCFRQKNFQQAVSTLRKIYTKQSRVFKIPVILASIMPVLPTDTPFSQYAQSNVIFTLNCIQWSIGAQKNCNAESFKYKMNKKISYWLLKEQIKKGIPTYYIPEIGSVGITVVQSVLKQVMELDLGLEILQACKVTNPLEVLLPFIRAWSMNIDPLLAGRALEFANQQGINMALIRPPGSESLRTTGGGLGVIGSSPFASGFGFGAVRGSMIPSNDSQDAAVQHRLYLLLRKFPDGILGSRIPIIYRDEFREPLRLRGQKLKDIMLALGADMVGEEGPGDKIFLFPSNQTF
eukprot:gene12049-25246_t